jgi:hypothetical protein
MAALMEQSSALARDFASAYRVGSRFTVRRMPTLWCSGAVVSMTLDVKTHGHSGPVTNTG